MMSLPIFYIDQDHFDDDLLTLSEETSKHVVQVLRMKEGARLHLTNGKGLLLTVSITEAHKKKTLVKITDRNQATTSERKICIAISLLKNPSRLEWFLEKAAELGVYQIIPLLCERTEKMQFRKDRAQQILISAMLQSRQTFLTHLHDPVKTEAFFRSDLIATFDQKWIAHCEEGNKRMVSEVAAVGKNIIMLIGPEGDFTEKEISDAIRQGFQPVSLGNTRLRTETAALTAAAFLCIQ
ncbi:MAG: RsmE family RNA methyltransferase [Bacteroidota bacterium]|jgi:16S rRNA (uracil1498-N3)-methyltransferase